MRITIVQTDIIWEDKQANLQEYSRIIAALKGKTDLIVLPEMCTTGFSMQAAKLAELNDGNTLKTLTGMACEYDIALYGSHIGKDDNTTFYNRGFFIQPNGKTTFYDKKHLFRMGEESKHYASGTKNTIVNYMGWNIRLAICYDLRFPVWLRNTNNEYDLLLVASNWPESRQSVFSALLTARALENQAFVCGVNRIGIDGSSLQHAGGSMLINAYGKTLSSSVMNETSIQTLDLNLEEMQRFREKFPVWKDADRFKLTP
jgi:omega-amidase